MSEDQTDTSNETAVLTELPAVAKNIFLPCKKCEVERWHRVLAHTTSTSAKVECEVCHSKKTFKLPKVQVRKAPRVPGAKKAATKRNSHIEEYQSLRDKHSAQKATSYNMKLKFNVDQIVEHPKFGVGFVRVTFVDKIEVLFEDEVRNLVHNRG
jgi:hypothetical protein